jgi:glycogen debranching enzyme
MRDALFDFGFREVSFEDGQIMLTGKFDRIIFEEAKKVENEKEYPQRIKKWILTVGLPDLALAQFLTPFDHQDESGALPDSVTHSEVLYNYVKPPIHGWALDRLRAEGVALDESMLKDIYGKLAKWTRFWLDARRAPGRALPYYQHGNDSGWDNSTAFDHDRTIESPDLAAFLLVQLVVLARLAEEIGEDRSPWDADAVALGEALVGELWRGDCFVARGVTSGVDSKRTSLLTLLPLLASPLLKREYVAPMIEGVRRMLTQFGPATQRVESPEYEPDGYWRGPIWAPSTMLIEDGLRRAGATELADDVSARFRRLCERSGFAENFDALTGVGLRDRAYTWTASVYLVLCRDAARREGEG